MQHLVNQLLSLAKQDAVLSAAEPVQILSLNQLTIQCIEQVIQLAIQKDIDLGVVQQQDLLIQGHEAALNSIIYNLIDNAIKYTPSQGIINVSIFKQHDQAILQVEDSGSGIEPAQFNQIRKRFYRIHHHAEIGSGLGLSIVVPVWVACVFRLNFHSLHWNSALLGAAYDKKAHRQSHSDTR